MSELREVQRDKCFEPQTRLISETLKFSRRYNSDATGFPYREVNAVLPGIDTGLSTAHVELLHLSGAKFTTLILRPRIFMAELRLLAFVEQGRRLS